MQSYQCSVCGYLYDQQSAEIDSEGNAIEFKNIDPEWLCPICGVKQTLFTPVDSDRVPDVVQSKEK